MFAVISRLKLTKAALAEIKVKKDYILNTDTDLFIHKRPRIDTFRLRDWTLCGFGTGHYVIFSKCLILVRVMVDIRTTGTKEGKHTLDRMSVHLRLPCAHTFTHLLTPKGNLPI